MPPFFIEFYEVLYKIFYELNSLHMEKFIYFFESLSIWVGRAFGWCILILTLSVTYEVFVRYVLNAPTVWVFDMMVQMYGGLFLMAAVCIGWWWLVWWWLRWCC